MKQLCFLFFFIGFSISIQAQNLNDKYMGTWVDNDSIGAKSMFFIGKNNAFIWTNINETPLKMRYDTYIGKYELIKDTLIIVLNKKLDISLSSGFQHIDTCKANSQKWLLSKDSNSLVVLEKYPSDNDLNKDISLMMSFRKFYIPTVRKYEKADYSYLKTESCKLDYWRDLIDLICK